MNISQLPTKYRYYPYYNGIYLGHVIEGYASINTAKQKLKNSLVHELKIKMLIYEEYFDSYYHYNYNNTIFYNINKNSPLYINGQTIDGAYNMGEEIHVNELNLSVNEYNELCKDILHISSIKNKQQKLEAYYEFERKYELYPHYKIDFSKYYKAQEDFINNKVEYREGKLTVNVHWKDTNITGSF